MKKGGLVAQTLADGGRQSGLVEGVEMQAGGAVAQEAAAHFGYHVQPQGFDGGGVVGIGLQLQPQPAWDFGAEHIGEAGECGEVGSALKKNWMMAESAPALHFVHEALDVVFGVERLQVVFGVGSHY